MAKKLTYEKILNIFAETDSCAQCLPKIDISLIDENKIALIEIKYKVSEQTCGI